MKKILILGAFIALLHNLAIAQFKKDIPFSNNNSKLNFSGKKLVKPETNNGTLTSEAYNFNKIAWSSSKLQQFTKNIKVILMDENNIPTWYESKSSDLTSRSSSNLKFDNQLKSELNIDPNHNIDFIITNSTKDELNIIHHDLIETYHSTPIYGSEYKIHEYPDNRLLISGKFKQPNIENASAKLTSEAAILKTKTFLQSKGIKFFKPNYGNLGKTTEVKSMDLFYFQSPIDNKWYLAYQLHILPNLRHNYTVFVDAQTGDILYHYSNICNMHAHCNNDHSPEVNPSGAEVANALDLFNTSRKINVWKEGSTYFMLDGSRPMFNLAGSKLPDEPAGGILTLDAKNTAFNENDFRVDHVTSTNNTWSNPTAVSAHFNGGKAYEYFANTHARNSIDGKGGSIVSIINVRDENGAKMDNAFWNGEAMFYGNGDQAFTSLAKALDVAGHEMSHGVIQNTANLTYQGESGAINESFADIFGAMIDRDDWKMGEDVVVRTYFPSGALRDLSNPNNGGNSSQQYWQPKHVSEQYKGSADNGGVHINSGITNYAFYLFVQELAKTRTEEASKVIAEKVYYRALTNYLSRSSQFKDLRVAVESAATDLHGNTDVLAAVKKAFDNVGIGGSGGSTGGTNYQKDLSVNPGKEFILCTDNNQEGIYTYEISTGNIVQHSTRTIKSKPSVVDNGTEIYYVGSDLKLYGLFYSATTKTYSETLIDADPIYRNAAISKDGKRLALLSNEEDNFIYIYDFALQSFHDFKLYNPTYSQGVNAGNVKYADFLDFDHSGQYVMYDALSEITKSTGTTYEFWDIGFLNVFKNSSNQFGDGKVEKLFSDLPENSSVGNPVFSKNSPYIITFDFLDEAQSKFSVLAANIETGDLGQVKIDRNQTGYPNYNVKDNIMLYDGTDSNNSENIYTIALSSNKLNASGSESSLLRGAKWGTWFALGNRSLNVNTKNIEFVKNLICYPNPVSEEILLSLESIKTEKLQIELYNTLGQKMLHESWNVNAGKNSKSMNLTKLATGTYELVISSNTGSNSTRIVKS